MATKKSSPLKPRRADITIEFKGSRKNPFQVIRQAFKDEGIREARNVLFEEADKMAAEVQLNILQQRLPLKKLSPQYLAWKKKQGLDSRILIASGDYVSEIKARRRAGGTIIEVGLPDKIHPDSGLTYKALARAHEYGVKKINLPERPHWRPMIEKFIKRVPQIKKRMQDRVNKLVFRKVARRFGKKTTKSTIKR